MLSYTHPVSKVIPQRELRNQNASIMAAVAAGESFVVTCNGTPVAELAPLSRARRTLVPKAELIRLVSRSPHVDATTLRTDSDLLVDQDLG